MTTIKNKSKTPRYIGKVQKKKLMASGQLYHATYSNDKDLYEKFGIPSTEKNVFVVVEKIEKKPDKKKSLQTKLEHLGYHVLSEKEIEENKPIQYPVPVSISNQKKVLKEIKNDIFKINEQDLAAIIGCSPRTISSVINGKNTFKTKSFKDKFNQLVKITNMLLGIIKKEYLPQWAVKKSKELKNRTPLDLLKTGDADELYRWAYSELECRYK